MTTEDWRAKEARKQQEVRESIFHDIATGIAPFGIQFAPPRDKRSGYIGDDYSRYRTLVTPEGEELGSVSFEHRRRSWSKKDLRIRLTSSRIPSRSRYGSTGHRDFTKIPNLILAIQKFCHPVSSDEIRAEEIRKEIGRINAILKKSYTRSGNPDGTQYERTYFARDLINRLASDEEMDVATAEEQLRILIRKRRVHNRWSAWVDENKLVPLRAELECLDLSKEKLS